VGINTAILSRSGGNQGVGFAVPVNLARSVMQQLIERGKVTRGYLGVMIQPVTPDLAKEFKLAANSGALVGDVTKDSPAERAVLKEGDVVVQFNGKKVTDSRHLRLMVSQTAPDTTVELKVLRDGKEQSFSVKLGELPSEGLTKADGRSGGLRRSRGADALDGVTVDDVNARTREQFNIPSGVRGAVVTDVDGSSPAAAAGLRQGDVIQEINRQRVTSADEAVKRSEEVKGDRVLLRVWSGGGSHYLVVEAKPTKR
jgi:serine protease Do